MKKILALILVAVVSFGFIAQIDRNSTDQDKEVRLDGPEIDFDKLVHDYGTIKVGADGGCYFKITNNGSEPLIISNAKGSCGCTVPSWPKEPINPGESAKMKVTYDTKRVGSINKSVTVTSNAVNGATKVVRIKGNVIN